MDLREVLATGAELLPDEGDGVQTEDLDSAVGEFTHQVDELAEDVGIGPVEVPLELVEGRPDPSLTVVVPGEIATRKVGEDLREILLPGIDLVLSLQDVEVVTVFLLTGTCSLSPLMLGRHMVDDQVHDQGDAVAPQRGRQIVEIVHRAQISTDRVMVGDGVAPVIGSLSWLQQGHEVQISHPHLGQMVQMIVDALEGACEAVGVGGVPDHGRLLQPVRFEEPSLVETLEIVGALGDPGHENVPDSLQGFVGAIAVDPAETDPQIGEITLPAQFEGLLGGRIEARMSEAVVGDHDSSLVGCGADRRD